MILQSQFATDTYLDVVKLISYVVGKFCLTYGGDEEEYRSYADEVFLRAYLEWDRTRGKPFHSYLRWELWMKMLNRRIVEIHRNSLLQPHYFTELEWEYVAMPETPSFDNFLGSMSPDAQHVAWLAINPVPNLIRRIKQRGGQPRNVRSSIRQFLLDTGWTMARINTAFAEIRYSLGGA